MTPTDKRKTRRRRMEYPSSILGVGEPRHCVVRDVSVDGARIAVETSAELPEEFVLTLSTQGEPMRRCRVIWRTDDDPAGRRISPAAACGISRRFFRKRIYFFRSRG